MKRRTNTASVYKTGRKTLLFKRQTVHKEITIEKKEIP